MRIEKANLQSKMNKPVETICMACTDDRCDFKPMKLQRRPVGDFDVLIDMKYCGVCHSDLSTAADHLKGVKPCTYPCVPGHELAGVVAMCGSSVTKFKVGQQVGVGCLVDSCKICSACKSGEEQNCRKHVMTYDGHGGGRAESYPAGSHTLGGYTTKMVVHEDFAILIPDNYPLEFAGPIMCSGITMYHPLKRFGMKEGNKVGLVGLGGLSQVGIKIAKALGCEVTVISRSSSKKKFAKACGADHFVVSSSPEDMLHWTKSLDLIINTIPIYHDYTAYHSLLHYDGRQVLLGLHAGFAGAMLVNKVTGDRSRVLHSMIGGIAATQEVMDLCAKHRIYPEIKIVPAEDLNKVFQLLDSSNDEGLRYVIDIANTLNDSTSDKCAVRPPPVLSHFSGGISPLAAIMEFIWLLFLGHWM